MRAPASFPFQQRKGDEPLAKPSTPRSNPRAYLYVLIPAGFVLLVVVLLALGWWEREVTPEPTETVGGSEVEAEE